MNAAAQADWSVFFAAAAGALGALAGLVFVSLSINLKRIMQLPGISSRAGETIVLLAGSLAGSLVALTPQPSAYHLGTILLLVAVPTWAVPTIRQVKSLGSYTRDAHWQIARRMVLHQFAALPAVLACVALYGGLPGGLGWLALGVIASTMVAMLNSWVLLVEILR